MERDLDAILRQLPPSDAEALARARARCQSELALNKRPGNWRREVAGLFSASAGLAALVAIVGLATGAFERGVVYPRVAGLVALAFVGAFAAYAALKPGARTSRWIALALAAVAAGVVVAARIGTQATPPTPEWVCSVSHVLMALVPISVAIYMLRRTAHSVLRATAAGLGAGTLGVMLGELACRRGVEHVVVHHLTAWAVVTALTVLIASRIRRKAFAP